MRYVEQPLEDEKLADMCSFATILSDWAKSTTCHGIGDVYKSRSCCGKLLWLLLTLIFLTIMLMQLFEVYGSFEKHQWLTSVIEESATAIEDFPTVTICSYNRLLQSERLARGLNDKNLIYIFDKIPMSFLLKSEIPTIGWNVSSDGREEFLNWKKTHNMSLKEIFQTMGIPCSKMISVVRNEEFRSGNCISSFNVNFTAIFTAEFGQCHQINIKLTNNIIIAGKMQGLSVLLRANLHDYLNITTNNYMDEGFAVQLHFGPQVALGQWMTIAPGFHYMFAMKERRLRARPPSDMFGVGYNLQEYVSLFGSKPPCEMYPKLKYDIAEKYSRPQCMHECSMDNFNKYCNCLPFYDSPSVRICELEELADCYNLLIEYNASRPSEACLLGCKEPCSDRTVETSITFGRFPPRSQIKDMEASLANIGESATLEQIREDFIMLDIYFEKLSITVVEWYEAQGFESLISSLGGVMSLWAGMSILTIVQAIVYFCHAFCCGLCLARKGKKNSPKVVPLSTASLTTSRSQPNLSTSKA